MTPAEQVVEMLLSQRRRGVSFADAWKVSIAAVEWPEDRSEWRSALAWARPHFEDSYLHPERPPAAILRALTGPTSEAVDRAEEEVHLAAA